MNQLTNLKSVPPVEVAPISVFSSLEKFQEVQQMAEFLSRSKLIPQDFQDQPQNVVIALSMAERMKADPMMVMQNLYVVHGRPGWSAQFLIASINSSGRFSALQYEHEEGEVETIEYTYFVNRNPKTGKETVKNDRCRAYATELSTNKIVHGPWVSVGMAVKENWYSKPGSKWQTMPELMLTYRAAAFFVRTKAPDISMGMQTVEEIRDMGDAVVIENESDEQAKSLSDLDSMIQQEIGESNAEFAEPGQEAPSQESIDLLKFFKESVDSCPDLESLKQCAADIGERAKELTEEQLHEIKSYIDPKMKAFKAEAKAKKQTQDEIPL